MQISPPDHLAPFIRHYIFLENSGKEHKSVRLFTDGSTGLIVSGNKSLHTLSGSSMPQSFFYGSLKSYQDFSSKGDFSFVAVVFQPYFLNILLKTSAKETLGQIVAVEDVLKNTLQPLEEALSTDPDPVSVFSLLNFHFTKLVSEQSGSDYRFIQVVQQYMLKRNGSVSSKELEKFTGYSTRHLERKFELHMGLSPKKYCNIIRLHYCIHLMNRSREQRHMAGISYHAGYADQAHLIREFKAHIGLTPKQYIQTKNKMAVNFIEL